MTFPVRCISCNKCIGQYERKYEEMVEKKMDKKDILDQLKITRYCCRRMFLGHVNIIDQLLLFPKPMGNTKS